MPDDRYWVYIVTNRPRGVLYLGVTNDLERRLWEHRSGRWRGFSRRYNCHRLVWMAGFPGPEDAIATEKRMTKWNRAWKIREIEAVNPDWQDLMPGEPCSDSALGGGSALAREMPVGAGMAPVFRVEHQTLGVIPAKAGTLSDGARRGGSALAREMPAGAGMTPVFRVEHQTLGVIPAKAGTFMDSARGGGSALAREMPADAGMTPVFLG